MSDFKVRFDNYDLNRIPYVEFVRRFPNEEVPSEIVSHNLVRQHGELVLRRRYIPKNVAVEGFIRAPSRTAYENSLDELKRRTAAIERPLVLVQSGDERTYIATKQNLIHEHFESGKAMVNIDFRCSDPFGKDDVRTVHEENITVASKVLDIEFGGTARSEPSFKFTINSVSDGGNGTMKIGNSHTGQTISVNRDFSAGDEIDVNSWKKRVMVNGVESDYQGMFPEFQPEQQTAAYSDDFSSRDVDAKVVYVKEYL